jgi:biotin carboxyl carrier protein
VLRRFSVKIGAAERIVELGLDDDGLTRVLVDGADKDVVLEQVEPGAWLVRHGNAQTLAYVDGENGKVTVGLKRGGEDVVLVATEVAEARSARVAALAQRARGAAAEGPLTVRSPMPGRLVKVLVKAGDRIAAGQAVVVVEAMKMENELRAPRAGLVRELRGTEGAAVESGQDLVVIDPAPGPG